MRSKLDNQIKNLIEHVLKMSAEVEDAIDGSIKALLTRNVDLASEVIRKDKDIDDLEIEIENKCISLIATQNPLASDLRLVMSIIKIITDLERIGDHAVNIAKVVIKIDEEEFIKPLIDLPKMADITKNMVKNSIDAFVNSDTGLAKEVAQTDDIVDDLYEDIYIELLYKLKENPSNLGQIINLLFIGRYLERIADHTTNICERIIYIVDGVREKY